MQIRGKGISFFHSYRSFTAYYTPETAHITFNIGEMKKLRKVSKEPFMSFIFMPLCAHEFGHFSQLAENPPGVILNLVKIRLENVKEIEKARSNNITKIKERVLKREILWNKLFAASYPIVEALSILLMKKFYEEFFSTQKLVKLIWQEEEPYYKKVFKKIAKHMELRILRLKIPNLSKDKLQEIMRKSWEKFCEDYVERMKENMEEAFKLFMEEAMSKDKRKIREVYKELERLSSHSSLGFAYFVAFFSLDIPLIDSSNLEKLDGLDLQHNPIQRFKLLINRLRELNEKKPLREIEIPTRYRSLTKIRGKLAQFIKQLTELEACCPKERRKIMKEIPFRHLHVKLRTTRLGNKEVRRMLRLGAKYLATKNFHRFFKNFVEKFISMPMVIEENSRKHLFLNEEYIRDDEWKSWWCKNSLILEFKYGERLKHPLQTYRFNLSDERRKELERFYAFMKEMSKAEVEPELTEESAITNREIRRLTGVH